MEFGGARVQREADECAANGVREAEKASKRSNWGLNARYIKKMRILKTDQRKFGASLRSCATSKHEIKLRVIISRTDASERLKPDRLKGCQLAAGTTSAREGNKRQPGCVGTCAMPQVLASGS